MRSCIQFTVTMDAKDLRTESALSERNNDGSKYSQSGGIAIHCDRNKSYQDIGSNSLAKVDVQSARPCAVIGPDRVVPPPAPSDAYLKKGPVEPWPCMDNAYHARRPPEYPHKLANFQNPSRNISPRQTFQENMQRIMVPPSYNSVKLSDENNYVQMSDRNNALAKNIKINVPPEAKFCDVPYTVYPNSNDQKNLRIPEMCMPSVNPTLSRTAPHGWPPGSVNIRPTRTYGAPELYQYADYSSCAGPRPVVPRPNRTVPDESGYVYADPFYHQEGNIRFKPYPTVKDRFPQQRYEYIGNYPNSFHPPPTFPSHKYEIQKSVPPHPYPPYPPIKYMDRVPEPVMEGYQRNQQGGYNIPYRNQIIHPNYGPVLNCPQNKIHSYPPDAHIKTVTQNKLPFDNSKAYIEYENGRPKMYPSSEGYLVNEMGKMHPMKSQVIMPNYPTLNMHNIPPNPYFKKDSQQMKNYEYIHFRNMDPKLNIHNPMVRHPPVFSPNTSAISPSDSSASNDTSQTLGTSQEDCGYVSQSSTASVRSMDSGINRIPNDCLRKYYDSRFGPIIRTAPMMSKSELNSNNNSKGKKNLDVRQFLQMWNEGDEEAEENNSKDINVQAGPKSDNNFGKSHEAINSQSQEQLYVLGLVNVPSEELGKYEHIQKVSKLPENIKGYNHIELLNQFEEAIEFSNMTNYKTSTPKDFQMPLKAHPPKQTTGIVPPRPLSPLDVEAKISQSVIHKEVGCNFEIKPCSPKMLNVDVATPVQNILAERAIEKVANPVMLKSPRINGIDENIDCNIMKRKDHRMSINNESVRIPSCKMVNSQFSNNTNIDSIKNSYSLQDLESNSGLCLASLPRLDNDIELNFPEVNQQFINANKGESVSTSLRDLPSLELLDNPDNQNKDKLSDIHSINKTNEAMKSPCIVESEKEFSKLSKYRKSKTHSLESKENQTHHVMNAARTDSVIIKNPENTKNYEDKSIFSPNCLNKVADIQQVPINLTSQGSIVESTTSAIIKLHDANQEKDTPIEIAIDFSLNKNGSNENAECFVKNRESEIFTHNSIETNVSMLDDHISKLPTFSDCHQDIQNTLNDHNKIVNNSVASPMKFDDLESVPEISLDADNKLSTSFINDPQPKDYNLIENKSLSPIAGVNDTQDNDMSTTVDLNVSKIAKNHSLLPIEFATPAVLLRTADCDSSDYLMDIDKNNDITATGIGKDNTIIENGLKDDMKNHNNVNQKEVCDDVVTNIAEDQAEVGIIKTVIDLELDIEPPKDNISRITESPVNEESSCSSFDFTRNEKIDKDISLYQSENTDKKSDSNFHLSLPDDIITDSQDVRKVNIEGENQLNLSSPIDTMDHSQNYCDSVVEKQIDSNVETTLLNDVAKLSPKINKSETVQREIESNLPSLNITPTHDREVFRSDIIERETDFNFGPLNNHISSYSPDNYESEINEEESTSILCSPSSNDITTQKLKHDVTETSQEKNYSYSEISNTVLENESATKNNDSCNLSKEVLHCDDLPDTDEKRKNILLKNTEEILEDTIITLPVLKEENKVIKLGPRYLSYGSKEMYSPWIQKLIMFCEGNIKDINVNSDNDVNTLFETKDVTNNFDICVKEETDELNVFDKIDSNINILCSNKSFAISPTPNNDENISLCNTSATEEDSNTEENNIHDEGYKNMEDEKEYNKYEVTKSNDANTHQDIDKMTSLECEQNVAVIKDKETVTNFSVVDDVEKLCNKLDAVSNFEDITSCLSPKVNEQREKKSICSGNVSGQSHKRYDNNDEVLKQSDKQFNSIDEKTESWYKPSYIDDDISEEWVKNSNCSEEVTEEWNKRKRNDEIVERWDKQSNASNEVPDQWDYQTNCDDEEPQWDKQSNCSDVAPEQWHKQYDGVLDQWDKQPKFNEEIIEQSDSQSNCNGLVLESSTNIKNNENCAKVPTTEHRFLNKKRQPLKRSLSDSALNIYSDNVQSEKEENVQFIWPFKRRKINNIHNDILAQNLCNIIQHNRRNSISAMYNEENVSFCILIDNGCIIAEEENDENEKICYTELSEECLAEIQNDCAKEKEEDESVEALTDVGATPEQGNDCEYSDSFVMQGEDEKLEESWVEDVACVETVISDDITEDIEISGPSSPKDDILSDNDESGVFSSCEHTDKVKYIYGDKMCNDDAQFVETLYNTPQMDVNRTLVQRETLISGEYYDNDSLEKILSESNEPELSPYVSEYTEPVFSPGIIDVKETVENKENMDLEIISQGNPLHIVDTDVDKIDDENVKLGQIFDGTQDDTVHSCESSVDNVFTYKESDENTNYTTSSSPEVSSTTPEEKNSAILLKITNYKGSRISQINDINRDSKRASCKFTEDKGYVQSHSNFPSHRPLLTKAAQKYIPPLKESMRDLKVKLSLPQHSLMKLKQLKISKDERKVCKPNISVPRISKKPKPKFEDVLKSIDEIQIKMHKEKTKKSKKSIPKVVIKKNENGSHYASTSNKDEFNPDLTGRKWQPWVFIEKNHFIDKMAIKKKTKAVYSHRKRTYVLAEKFQKYKSVNSAKFVISPPISDCPSTGLKYTIRLKHTY